MTDSPTSATPPAPKREKLQDSTRPVLTTGADLPATGESHQATDLAGSRPVSEPARRCLKPVCESHRPCDAANCEFPRSLQETVAPPAIAAAMQNLRRLVDIYHEKQAHSQAWWPAEIDLSRKKVLAAERAIVLRCSALEAEIAHYRLLIASVSDDLTQYASVEHVEARLRAGLDEIKSRVTVNEPCAPTFSGIREGGASGIGEPTAAETPAPPATTALRDEP